MNLTFQVCKRNLDGNIQNYGMPTEDPAIAADGIRKAASFTDVGPIYMKGVITNGSQSRTVYVNPEWELGDEPIDWSNNME